MLNVLDRKFSRKLKLRPSNRSGQRTAPPLPDSTPQKKAAASDQLFRRPIHAEATREFFLA
jgi:hypothetical protein